MFKLVYFNIKMNGKRKIIEKINYERTNLLDITIVNQIFLEMIKEH